MSFHIFMECSIEETSIPSHLDYELQPYSRVIRPSKRTFEKARKQLVGINVDHVKLITHDRCTGTFKLSLDSNFIHVDDEFLLSSDSDVDSQFKELLESLKDEETTRSINGEASDD